MSNLIGTARRERLGLGRQANLFRGGAAQFAAFRDIEVTAAVERGRVVPHHEITDPPLMPINELALRGMFEQIE